MILRTLRKHYDKRKGLLLSQYRRTDADPGLNGVIVASFARAMKKENGRPFLFL
jgi:hypothetical protein